MPVTVSARAAEPAAVLDCESDTRPGAARLAGVIRLNVREFDAPTELDAETFTCPGKAVSVGRIVALNCVELTNVVAWGTPFQFTTASLVKFVPFTVSVIPVELQ